jgi:hypothetical protein
MLALAQAPVTGNPVAALREVQQYNFAIHILAMLLVGFGFLMVFVQRYGYSATTGTYLVTTVAGYILRATGTKNNIYEDNEEFIQTEMKASVVEE